MMDKTNSATMIHLGTNDAISHGNSSTGNVITFKVLFKDAETRIFQLVSASEACNQEASSSSSAAALADSNSANDAHAALTVASVPASFAHLLDKLMKVFPFLKESDLEALGIYFKDCEGDLVRMTCDADLALAIHDAELMFSQHRRLLVRLVIKEAKFALPLEKTVQVMKAAPPQNKVSSSVAEVFVPPVVQQPAKILERPSTAPAKQESVLVAEKPNELAKKKESSSSKADEKKKDKKDKKKKKESDSSDSSSDDEKRDKKKQKKLKEEKKKLEKEAKKLAKKEQEKEMAAVVPSNTVGVIPAVASPPRAAQVAPIDEKAAKAELKAQLKAIKQAQKEAEKKDKQDKKMQAIAERTKPMEKWPENEISTLVFNIEQVRELPAVTSVAKKLNVAIDTLIQSCLERAANLMKIKRIEIYGRSDSKINITGALFGMNAIEKEVNDAILAYAKNLHDNNKENCKATLFVVANDAPTVKKLCVEGARVATMKAFMEALLAKNNNPEVQNLKQFLLQNK